MQQKVLRKKNRITVGSFFFGIWPSEFPEREGVFVKLRESSRRVVLALTFGLLISATKTILWGKVIASYYVVALALLLVVIVVSYYCKYTKPEESYDKESNWYHKSILSITASQRIKHLKTGLCLLRDSVAICRQVR